MAKQIKKSKTKKSDQIEVARAKKLEDKSSEQPIECVFSDMSERLMRIQRDLLMPAFAFESEGIQNTITMFGAARIKPEEVAIAQYKELQKKKSSTKAHKQALEKAKMAVEMSKYYTAAEELARRLQEWSNCLDVPEDEKYYIMTGGGPGIMEAANKGSYRAGGKTVGATITIPDEQKRNPFLDRGVWVNFNYFLMRKFWLLFFAKAVVVFPGGTGTFDEFFEVFTLMKTRKTRNYLPIVLFGRKFWKTAVDFDYLVKTDVITKADLEFFKFADTVEEAFNFITKELQKIRPLKSLCNLK